VAEMDEAQNTDHKLINPEGDKEVKGLLYAFLFILGTIICIAGTILAAINVIIGDVVWILGGGIILFLIKRSLKHKQGGGFRVANIVMKIIVLAFLLIFLIVVNIAKIFAA
jgi:hypothetical protein